MDGTAAETPLDMRVDEKTLRMLPALFTKVRAEIARRSLKEYWHQAWKVIEPGTPLVWGWALDALVEHLEAVARREIKRLVINIPPGASKSVGTRVIFPTWVWTREPHHRFLSASYSLDLTIRDNLNARRIVASDWYRESFDITIAEDDGGKVGFSTDKLGSIKAVTVGTGKTTGFRGDTFLIDDPINVQDANSPVKRAEALDWFREAAQNRINDAAKSAIIVIMQRVHEDDVAAAALEMGYDHLCIPMRWDESLRKTTRIGWTDPRKEDGELMFPERFPKEWVDQTERNMGPYAFSAQYQQRPVPRKGAMFAVERIGLYEELPDEPFISVRAWDLAGTAGAGAYTVGLRMRYGRNSRKFYIDDVARAQLSAGAVRDLIREIAALDGVETKIILPRDPGQAGLAQIADLTAMLAGYNVSAETQSGSKELRAEPLASHVENGHVLVRKETWTGAFVEELRMFPKGRYRDQVDAAASAFNALAAMTRVRRRQLELVVGGERTKSILARAANGEDIAMTY